MGPSFNAWPLGHSTSEPSDQPSSHPPASSPQQTATSSLPFAIRKPFEPDQSSATLVSSTAEGKPIPVDDSVVETRTSALRELNNHYPSRHRYAKSTGAQSTTYSEPVLVRSYYPPASARVGGSSRRGVLVQHSQPTTATENEGTATGVRRVIPFTTTVASARNGTISNMARTRTKKLLRAGNPEQPRLPPVEAFTFKSFMENMEAQAGPTDISADLDRIAEICAKSRYSLSNQYEVHYQPHGSGSAFMRNPPNSQDDHQGPTLQVVNSDDENSTRSRRRRGLGRRNSRAMGTLETIMSSSRSSDEERSRKKSASELAEQVRGRASTTANSTGSISSHSTHKSKEGKRQATIQHESQTHAHPATFERRNSTLALIDSSKYPNGGESSSPRSSAPGLVSLPALPQASTSQLELRTAPEGQTQLKSETESAQVQKKLLERERKRFPFKIKAAEPSSSEGTSLLFNLSSWMPWNGTDNSASSITRAGRAEGSLRELLRNPNGKGKWIS